MASASVDESVDLDELKRSPAFWAKLGHHPYWPAKWASKEERIRYQQHQRKSTHMCVKFYGSHDIGWVAPSAVLSFEEGMRKQLHLMPKVNKNAKFQLGMEEAKRIMEDFRNGNRSSSLLYAPGLYPAGTSSSLLPLLEPTGGSNGGAAWGSRPVGSEKCLTCNDVRGEDDITFLTCRKCGSSYHGRCVSTSAGGEGGPSSEPVCTICKAVLQPAGPPASALKGVWGLEAGKDSDHRSCGDDDRSTSRGRHHHEGGGSEKKRRVSTQDRRVRWEAGGDWDGSVSDGEDSCFICKEPGMLITCDGHSCRKAFHKPCLAYSAWAQDFVCPRHKCVVCHASEADLVKAAKSSGSPSTDSAAKSSPSTTKLWRCSTCPVSYCPAHLPAGYSEAEQAPPPQTTKSGRVITNLLKPPKEHEDIGPQCFHCRNPTPLVRLARIIERSWARLACNYLSLPFMRPFLHGVPPPASLRDTPRLDLVAIILKARALEYTAIDDYLADLRTLVSQTKKYCDGEEEVGPLVEAIETLEGNGKRFMSAVRKEVKEVEALLDEEGRQKAQEGSEASGKEPPFGAAGWREECKQPEEEGLPIEYCPCKTLSEWAEYVSRAPLMYAETQKVIENPDDRERHDRAEIEKGMIAQVIATLRYDDRVPHQSLRQHSELESQLEEQSILLSRCLEGHALLRKKIAEEKAWALKYKLPKPGKRKRSEAGSGSSATGNHAEGLANGGAEAMDVQQHHHDGAEESDEEDYLDSVVTIGEMHVVKELQLSNSNLRKRLECKAEILRQREEQLAAAKKIYRELEDRNKELMMRVQELEAKLQQQEGQATPSKKKKQPVQQQQDDEEEEEEEGDEGAKETQGGSPEPAAASLMDESS